MGQIRPASLFNTLGARKSLSPLPFGGPAGVIRVADCWSVYDLTGRRIRLPAGFPARWRTLDSSSRLASRVVADGRFWFWEQINAGVTRAIPCRRASWSPGIRREPFRLPARSVRGRFFCDAAGASKRFAAGGLPAPWRPGRIYRWNTGSGPPPAKVRHGDYPTKWSGPTRRFTPTCRVESPPVPN